MNTFFHIDWKSVLVPSISLGEIILRGTVMYLFLFVLFRVLRRDAGAIGISDVLLVVLVADAAQNGMSSDYKSVSEAVVLVGTIAFWNYVLDWLGYRFPGLQRLLRPAPLPLIKDGRILRRNLRQEFISVEELMGLLREKGIERVEDVKQSYMEGDGHVSVIKK